MFTQLYLLHINIYIYINSLEEVNKLTTFTCPLTCFGLKKSQKNVNASFSHLKMFDINLRNENNLEMNVFGADGSKIVELEAIR